MFSVTQAYNALVQISPSLPSRGTGLPSIPDPVLLDSFDVCVARVEELVRSKGFLVPQVLGGEPTLWSDWLVEGILHRLRFYPTIIVMSNLDRRGSLWEEDDRVVFYRHLAGWRDLIGTGYVHESRVLPMVVACHGETDDLAKFLSVFAFSFAHGCHPLTVAEYSGSDPSFLLSVSELRFLDQSVRELNARYGRCISFPASLRLSAVSGGEDFRRRACVGSGRRVWEVDCVGLSAKPCCGHSQMPCRIEAFEGQSPQPLNCRGCGQWVNFLD